MQTDNPIWWSYYGRGVTRNVRTARSWYQKSADQYNNADA